ncbi:serine/threonine-protein kinase [Streptomyces sp. LX-29]|uniref:serine/threonine-protein kinase n=1 Tax=Streptomyces sp. LX-29 TaxID=2900152 RepID=UPI00240E7CC8|nr:serine/threonine-protein kinase [Streptomyces sp. LX-29]WFB08106.1 serine/threonine-protein kinase [Streptomyces sp. LX-29]
MPPLRSAGTGPEAEDPGYAGQYRLEARLGSGGMGVVHLARSTSGLRLAVKVVHAEYAADPEFRARFRQEVAAARRVSGAFTAPVVDADPDGERPWMATLYIPGPTLSEHVKRNGPLETDEVLQLAAGLAEALRDIHRAGVVHRDLKPSNVLLAADGPKVIDFGISRPADSDLRTETGKLIGTPPFMAPEQFQRPRQVGPAADVFALGSVLVHAATGSGPFDSESPYIVAYQVVHDEADLAGVPAELTPLVRRCLAKDPDERPTPDALMAALRAVRGPYAPAPRGPAPRVPAQRGPARDGEAGADEPFPGGVGDACGTGPTGGDAGSADTHIRAAGPGSGSRNSGDSGQGPEDPERSQGSGGGRRSLPTRLRGRRGWIAAGLAVTVVFGAGTLWSLHRLDELRSDPHRPPAKTAKAWHPWETTLGADPQPGREGGGQSAAGGHSPRGAGTAASGRAAYCGYARGALYCAGPGVRAARLNPADGDQVWSLPGARRDRDDGAPTPPVFSGGLVQVLSPDGTRLEAFDPDARAAQRSRWSRNVSAYAGRVYRAGDTTLLVSADGTVTAIDAADNSRRWRHRIAGHTLPVFFSDARGRVAYAVTATPDGSRTLVTALDPVLGTVHWQHGLPGNLTPVGTGPEGVVLFTEVDAQTRTTAVVRFDPVPTEARRVPLPTPVTTVSATSRGDTVFLLGADGGLVALGTGATGGSGKQLWRLETSVGNASPLVAAGDDRLYFSAADGRLLAVDTDRGELMGETPTRTGKADSGYLDTLPAPVVADGKVFGSAPDGTVFAVDERAPSQW